MARNTGNRWGEGSRAYERWRGNPWDQDAVGNGQTGLALRQTEPWEETLNTAKDATYMTQIERDIIFEYNKVRWDPVRYGQEVIEPSKKWFSGYSFLMGGKFKVSTKEGIAAVDKCLRALDAYGKSGPYLWAKPVPEFYNIALEHASDQSKSGGTGHVGSDGRGTEARILSRLSRGSNYSDAVENIAYGIWCDSPQLLMHQLLVDDGLPNRTHQANIFMKSMSQIGCTVRTHPRHGFVAVQVMGFGMVPKS